VAAVVLASGLGLGLARAEQLTLNGAGATFPYPLYSRWFDEYHKTHDDVSIRYQSIGSGGGIRQVIEGSVDFGATDGPMSDEQLGAAQGRILHIPTVLGAVVPAFNVQGVTELKLTGPVIDRIIIGQYTTWNDPAIARL
jgi:phosphate transport system substrate-binding protein